MEIIGVLAGIVVLLSFVPSNIKIIRIINIAGCILFIIYGIGIKSISVAGTNGALLAVHAVNLVKLFKKKEIAK